MWFKPSGNKSQTATDCPSWKPEVLHRWIKKPLSHWNSEALKVCVTQVAAETTPWSWAMIYWSSCLCGVVIFFNRFSSNVPILFTLLSPFQTSPAWWGQGNIVKDFLWLLMISWVFIRATMRSDLVTYLAHSEGIAFQSITGTLLAHD